MPPSPRSRAERLADTRARLVSDVDVWVATAHPDGGPPAMVPLSFSWNGIEILLATLQDSPTARNLRASGQARLAFGEFRDVVMIDAAATQCEVANLPADRWDAYVERAGWDPRREGPAYVAFRLRPVRVQAWRESNEIAGRTLMRHGRA